MEEMEFYLHSFLSLATLKGTYPAKHTHTHTHTHTHSHKLTSNPHTSHKNIETHASDHKTESTTRITS